MRVEASPPDTIVVLSQQNAIYFVWSAPLLVQLLHKNQLWILIDIAPLLSGSDLQSFVLRTPGWSRVWEESRRNRTETERKGKD